MYLNKMKYFLLTSVSFILLSACTTVEEKVVTVNKPVLFPTHLASDCSVPKPPAKDTYLNASTREKEAIWATTILEHYRAFQECNNRLESLRKWREEQIRIYKVKEE